MIKRTIHPARSADAESEAWIPLENEAEVEITSERPDRPIEAALARDDRRGWRAAAPGEQTIRIRFSPPRPVKQIRLVVEERERERTQQFVLRTSPAPEGPWHEVARQQFNFSPGGATREQEDYFVNEAAVSAVELMIVPDIRGGDAEASLAELRLR